MKKIKIMLNIGLVLGFLAAPTWAAEAMAIAKSEDLPGKYQSGQCAPFARALYKRLAERGFRAKLVVYRWTGLLSSGRHAIVVFEDGGRWYMTDNISWKPKWVSGPELDQLKVVVNDRVDYIEDWSQVSEQQWLANTRRNP